MITKRKKRVQDLPVLHPDAAGIDIGASEVFVAVPADRDAEPVRSFPTFTRDLHVLADWLHSCEIRSVAMESTTAPSPQRYDRAEWTSHSRCDSGRRAQSTTIGRIVPFACEEQPRHRGQVSGRRLSGRTHFYPSPVPRWLSVLSRTYRGSRWGDPEPLGEFRDDSGPPYDTS